MTPAFSVVIPTYNQADFLRAALTSVLEQSFLDFEVIVVNNCSSDRTLEVIQELSDPRVRVINFRNNGVIGASRNVGIRAAQGPYVAFLDSDDKWHKDKLEKVAKAFADDSTVGLVCHDLDLVREGQVVARTRFGPSPRYRGSMYEHLLFSFNGPATSASVVAKQRLEEAGLFSENPDFVTVEDYDLWLGLAKLCRFRFLPEVLGNANLHTENASGNIELHLRNGLALIDKHCAELRRAPRRYPKRVISRLYARSYYVAARRYHRRGAFKLTLAYYFRTLLTYPLFGRAYAGMTLLIAGRILRPFKRRGNSGVVIGPSKPWGSQL